MIKAKCRGRYKYYDTIEGCVSFVYTQLLDGTSIGSALDILETKIRTERRRYTLYKKHLDAIIEKAQPDVTSKTGIRKPREPVRMDLMTDFEMHIDLKMASQHVDETTTDIFQMKVVGYTYKEVSAVSGISERALKYSMDNFIESFGGNREWH
jgi:hypothetical protein